MRISGLSTPRVYVVRTLVEARQIRCWLSCLYYILWYQKLAGTLAVTLSDSRRTKLATPVIDAVMRNFLCPEVSGCAAVLSVVDDTSVL